ncbi:MAG: hypothetical protein JJU31_08870 [Wenzhouxiangella sp.]|nr:hypothetical protein [Wenzhouxiangella sp.]TVR94922.1 MAG: hypothetical protein EA418_08955 [Wenzhouxiangellaceae bacterium]
MNFHADQHVEAQVMNNAGTCIRRSACLSQLALGVLLILLFASSASAIDADLSGNWASPGQPGHGLQVEVLPDGRAVVAWYVYDSFGNPLWLFGEGLIQGSGFRADMDARAGAGFPPNFDPDDVIVERWGWLEFVQNACNEAEVRWQSQDPAYGSGNLELVRVTRIDGLGCREDRPFEQVMRFSFQHGPSDFDVLFLDYPEGEEEFFELDWGHASLPAPWDSRSGLFLEGANRSDDLMMLLQRPIDGLKPDTPYLLQLEMQLLSNEPSGCVGIGGSPGDSVYLKLGAASQAVAVELEDSGLPDVPPMRRPSIDLGIQSQPGEFSRVVGTLANGQDDSLCSDEGRPWVLQRRHTDGQPLEAVTDGNGRLWVFALSDSGFEGKTRWYLTEFTVRLQPVSD